MATSLLHGTVIVSLALKHAYANSTAPATSPEENAGVKTVITMVALVVIFCLSAAIAKCVDVCFVQRSGRAADDESVTDNVRVLIQTRLSVMRYAREEASKRDFQTSLTFFRRWVEKVKSRKSEKLDIQNNFVSRTKCTTNGASENGVIPVENVVKDGTETETQNSTFSSFFSRRTKTSDANGVIGTLRPASGSLTPGRKSLFSKTRVVPEVTIIVTEADSRSDQTKQSNTRVPKESVDTVHRTCSIDTLELHNESEHTEQT